MENNKEKTNCGNLEYIIRPGNQNVIVAKLEPVSVYDECKENDIAFQFSHLTGLTVHTGKIIKSVAICSDMDEYNESLGKKIASIKAEQKYHNKMINSYNKLLKELDSLKQYYSEKIDKHNSILESVNKRADKIFNSLK